MSTGWRRFALAILCGLVVAAQQGGVRSASGPGEPARRASIVVKLKGSTAAGAFAARTGLAAPRAVHAGRIEASRMAGLGDLQLAEATRRRFPARAGRAPGAFRPPDLAHTFRFDVAASESEVQALVARLACDPDVVFAEADGVAQASLVPNDPYYSSTGTWGQAYDDLYGLKKMGTAAAWDVTQGQGVLIAVVDTGLDSTHPDLAANVWTNANEVAGNGLDDDGNGYVDDVRGWDFVGHSYSTPAPDSDPRDGHGHGTHVAGTAAGVGDNGLGVAGVAYRATVMAVKGLDDFGYAYDSQLAAAVVYAADNGADVINASWGGPGDSQVLREAVDYASSLGVVFVAAAGNSNGDARNFSPAAFSNVITVAATDAADALAYFSNWGPRIDVAAPGVDILSLRAEGTNGGNPVGEGYTRMSGTSMAAPHVAGLAALVLASHPAYSAEQVRQALRVSAVDLGAAGFDARFGYGRVSAAQAVAVDGALESRVQSPADGAAVTGAVAVAGRAAGPGFVRYELAYGAGVTPTSWTLIQEGTTPVTGGALGTFDAGLVPDGVYTLRLTSFDGAGRAYTDRRALLVDYVRVTDPAQAAVLPTVPLLKPGPALAIAGRATGPSFVRFRVEWARGRNPASGWSAAGVTLAGGGLAPVDAGPLATWDDAAVAAADYYTVRVLVDNAGFTSESRTIVYLEPALASASYPRFLSRGPWVFVSALPSLDVSGQRTLVVTSPRGGSVRHFRLSADGASLQATDEVIVNESGGFFQAPVANLSGQPGDETIVPWTNFLRALRSDGSAYNLPGPSFHGLMRSSPVVADLDGQPGDEVLAVATYFFGGTGRLQAWNTNGTPRGGAFPVALADRNLSVSNDGRERVLAADVDGDGTKEIVAIEGPTTTSLAVRAFNGDGTPKAGWNTPTLEANLVKMGAADLDGDGTTEVVLLVNQLGTITLHVLGGDGSERAGWPRQLTLGEPYFAIGDLDRDGQNEIVVTSAYTMWALRPDGTSLSPSWPRAGGDYYGAPVIGDLDGDGYPEIVVYASRNGYYDPLFPLDSGLVIFPVYFQDDRMLALRRDGTVMRTWQLAGVAGQQPVGRTVPMIADVDGDGRTDVVFTGALVPPGAFSVEDGYVSVLTTGSVHREGANDWPLYRHDAKNGAVLPRDVTAPTVSLTAPAAGATLTSVTTLRAAADDDRFVRGVRFKVDGVDAGAEDLSAPFEMAWDPRGAGNGTHELTAVARDTAGNLATSAPVTVTVDVDLVPPQAAITAPAAGTSVSGPVTVTADASDDRQVVRVDLSVDGTVVGSDTTAPYAFAWDPRTLPDGTHTLVATAYDGTNSGASAAVPVVVAVPPTVTLTAPLAGATLSTLTTLTATATDTNAVTSVQFYAGSTLLGTDASAPWSVTWNASQAVDGPYALTARATDAAGNVGVSPAVPVTVTNLPTVSISAPGAGAVVSAPITVTATASDPGGIARVELWVGGVLRSTDTDAPYAFPLDPATYPDGNQGLVAKAYDAAGNAASSVTVTVRMAAPPVVLLTAPAAGTELTGTVALTADAADNVGVARVDFYLDTTLLGSDTSAPYTFALDTLSYGDGAHTLSARGVDAAGNVGTSPGVAVTLRNGNAVYDPVLRVPSCAAAGSFCDSGPLLNGRRTLGPEPNQPNTINGSCADGTAGTYHADESNDRLRVATLDGSPLRPGVTVQVRATVWAYSGFSSDALDLYYASNASSPTWVLIGTFTPPGAGARAITASYTLPFSPRQAVRARFRYSGAAAPCGTGSYDDHDDLVFAVQLPPDGGPPTAAITAPASGATLAAPLTVTADATDDVGVAKVELRVDGTLVGTDTTAPYSFAWTPATVGDGAHTLVARAYDLSGSTTDSAPVPVTVAVPPTVGITSPFNGALVNGTVPVSMTASDNSGVVRVELAIDGSNRAVLAAPPYSYSWSTASETQGSHTLVATAFDAAGLSTASAPVTVQVQIPTAGTAVYDAALKAPRCSGPVSFCDSAALLVGRGTMGPEPNQPNTLVASCTDDNGGTFHGDESNDRMKVSTVDGSPFGAGKTVRVEATVWAYAGFSSDKLDLYYTASAAAPSWTFLATLSPVAAGSQVLSATYVLPSGPLQAVRARFRYGGTAIPCGAGLFNDHDDLVFEVP